MYNEYTGGGEQIKYFCDAVRLRNTDEYFQMQVESGGTHLVFTLTPENAKRLGYALSHYVSEFERLHRKINTSWTPDIASPYKPEELKEPHYSKNNSLYEEAMALVIASQKASATFIERKLDIDAMRAALLIDMLEAEGIVSSANGKGVRRVLVKSEKKKKQS